MRACLRARAFPAVLELWHTLLSSSTLPSSGADSNGPSVNETPASSVGDSNSLSVNETGVRDSEGLNVNETTVKYTLRACLNSGQWRQALDILHTLQQHRHAHL